MLAPVLDILKADCFSDRIISAGQKLRGIHQSRLLLLRLNSVSCFVKGLLTLHREFVIVK